MVVWLCGCVVVWLCGCVVVCCVLCVVCCVLCVVCCVLCVVWCLCVGRRREGWLLLVVVVRTRCTSNVSVDTTVRMHLITMAEHLGVRLPVSPPPGPQRPDGRRPKNAAFLQQKQPSLTDRRPARVDLGVRSPPSRGKCTKFFKVPPWTGT